MSYEFDDQSTAMDSLLGRELLEAAHAFDREYAVLCREFADWNMIQGNALYAGILRALEETATVYRLPAILVKHAWDVGRREKLFDLDEIDYDALCLDRLYRWCKERAIAYDMARSPRRRVHRMEGHFDLFDDDDGAWIEEP